MHTNKVVFDSATSTQEIYVVCVKCQVVMPLPCWRDASH